MRMLQRAGPFLICCSDRDRSGAPLAEKVSVSRRQDDEAGISGNHAEALVSRDETPRKPGRKGDRGTLRRILLRGPKDTEEFFPFGRFVGQYRTGGDNQRR